MKDIEVQREFKYGKEVAKMKARPSVLVVDDEAIMRESLKDWLAEEGYQVATAEDGEQALQMIQEQEFRVAVLDLRLPGKKDGIEVLKEAREHQPKLKGIIITAYPSVETAVEAIKFGAVDYMTKPFAPSELERLIEQVLGPVQLEIKPEASVEVIEEAKVEVKPPRVEEVIPPTEAEIPTHLEKGREHLKAGHLIEAIKEFEAILKTAPGNLEARMLLRQARERAAKPVAEGELEEAIKPCVWMKIGVVQYRICTRGYECLTCEFDQAMQQKMVAGGGAEVEQALQERAKLPGPQRLCRYALTGQIAYRLCTRLFQCTTCEFGQTMEEAVEQKLARLAARREALRKKTKRTGD